MNRTKTSESLPDRSNIVAIARGWIGTPYHHQASRRGVGTDCLGLVRGIWRELYGTDPGAHATYARDWAEVSARETLLTAATHYLDPIAGTEHPSDQLPGRLLVFRFRIGSPAKHLGICTGDGRMIHTMEGHPVAEVPIVPWWRRRVAGVFDFPGLAD